MASRRDELNAYTFARRRTVGAFLQPAGGGNDEDAPRPVRAVVPSMVMSVVIIAGFGMWGLIKPAAPQGWDDTKSIVVGKDSTTRYVVLLDEHGKKILHPVLNMASAKLVLDAGSKVVFVKDSVLDEKITHGATIGIPYAPDKLPDAGDAAQAKVWSVCDRPGGDKQQSTVNQAVFVATGVDAKALHSSTFKLAGGDALYVQGPDGGDGKGTVDYLVDAKGFRHELRPARGAVQQQDARAVRTGLFGPNPKPQQVSQQWLDTLGDGTPITFPGLQGFLASGAPSTVRLSSHSDDVVGRVLSFDSNSDGTVDAYYVVGQDQIYKLTDFQAQLFINNPAIGGLYPGNAVVVNRLTPADEARWAKDELPVPADWPLKRPNRAVNGIDVEGSTRNVVCSTYEGLNGTTVQRSVWASSSYPASFTSGAASAHVTAGHGLLYRAMDGTDVNSGTVFLITETGLRYQVQANNDSDAKPGAAAAKNAQSGQAAGQDAGAQARLGYKDIQPGVVPKPWSDLVPAGPNLSTAAATKPQNS
jgi:type VII secretion protein EccB